MAVTIDSSPWGLAAYLSEDDSPVSWFSTKITEDDVARYGVAIGSCTGQQIWESLGALLALRTWKLRWLHTRVNLRVRGDNITMLQLLVKLRPPSHSDGLGLIARELALDIAEAVYGPDVSEHIPGIANVTADTLSRRYEPGFEWTLPLSLARVPEARAPARDASFYRTIITNCISAYCRCSAYLVKLYSPYI
jgi:hypothetical protein